MKRRRHTPEQIIRKLREADRLLAERQEISEATYHRWRAQYGGLKADDVKRLKELEGENARLKRIVADKELQIEALKELGRGGPARPGPTAQASAPGRLDHAGGSAGGRAPEPCVGAGLPVRPDHRWEDPEAAQRGG